MSVGVTNTSESVSLISVRLLSGLTVDMKSMGIAGLVDHTRRGSVINRIIHRVRNYRFVFAPAPSRGCFVFWSLSVANLMLMVCRWSVNVGSLSSSQRSYTHSSTAVFLNGQQPGLSGRTS